MKIVNIIGGLGNQMFQYALAKSLETKFGDAVLVDTSLFDTYNVHNGLEIERVFNLKLHRANECDIRQLTRYTRHYSLWRIYRRILPHKKRCVKKGKMAVLMRVFYLLILVDIMMDIGRIIVILNHANGKFGGCIVFNHSKITKIYKQLKRFNLLSIL